NLGRKVKLGGSRAERWKTMALVALGQKKMFNKPTVAFFHILIYVGFIIINVEVLEIIIDGVLSTHRSFANITFIPPAFYNFINYLPYSKHFHIILSFPNVYWSNLKPQGYFNSNAAVTNEVKLMLDPSAITDPDVEAGKFGAKDVTDLSWKQLMDAYSCTECG